MSPPGCWRGGSEIRSQWGGHVSTQPSSSSILKTPGNSQQLPCLSRVLSEEALCPQELSCIKLSAQCLSTLYHSYVLLPCLGCWENALQVPVISSVKRKDALLPRQPSSSTHIPSGQHSSLVQMLVTDLYPALLQEGPSQVAAAGPSLHTAWSQRQLAIHPDGEGQGRKPFLLPAK